MNTHTTHDSTPRRVTSLRELPMDIAPERDLWPEIEARLAAERGAGSSRFRSKPHLHLLALAAVISAVAVGVWLGRNVLPGANQPAAVTAQVTPATASDPTHNGIGGASTLPAAYVKQRAALLASFDQQVRALPPKSPRQSAREPRRDPQIDERYSGDTWPRTRQCAVAGAAGQHLPR